MKALLMTLFRFAWPGRKRRARLSDAGYAAYLAEQKAQHNGYVAEVTRHGPDTTGMENVAGRSPDGTQNQEVENEQ